VTGEPAPSPERRLPPVAEMAVATMILVVPRAKYGELTRGLAQIGAWQMESDAGPLPNPVHVAVRLAR